MDDRVPYTGPTIVSRNLTRDDDSRHNIYVAIETSFTRGKGILGFYKILNFQIS